MSSKYPHFVIVTPSYDLEAYIEQTILSVISQAGDFTLHYHIQDGGSKDGTAAILEKWKVWLDAGAFPLFCRGVDFSYDIDQDEGMYDAINKGFSKILTAADSCLMTWINADDIMPAGSLAAVCSFLDHMPSASFLGGRTTLMSENGFIAATYDPQPRLRSDIIDGHYSGGEDGYLQQEGIFWRSELWKDIGGLDSRLRLAGDFDLWMRMAAHAEYYPLDTITGIHRKRAGQLSSGFQAYNNEVKTILKRKKSQLFLPQDLLGHYAYDLQQKSWDRKEAITERSMERLSVNTFEGSLEFARDCYRRARNKKLPPWWLTISGWKTRHLRNQLLSARKKLQGYIKLQLRSPNSPCP